MLLQADLDTLQAAILALIQGITEFLPISSSAHLVLPSFLLGWPDQGLAFDTTLHLASLTAVIFHFRRDVIRLSSAAWQQLTAGRATDDAHTFWCLLIASLPIIPLGFMSRNLVEAQLRDPLVIAAATILFGLLLAFADRRYKGGKPARELTLSSALGIGLAQCLALVPGTSRAGITMTMALLSGFSREAAARISFLISIPAISGAACIKLIDLARSPVAESTSLSLVHLATGFVVAGLSAYLCIRLFLEFISRISFLPFVIYRLALGSLLLVLFL